MDFVNFEPIEPVMVQSSSGQECDDDDPQSAPFVDENPCLVCGHKAFANFIDLTFGTSCTTQTNTSVKRKLKDILGRIWDPKRENQILCLACYDLVDRYDALESQLITIRENIEEKYRKTCHKRVGGRGKFSNSAKKRRQANKSKKAQPKKKTDVNSFKFQVLDTEADVDNDDAGFVGDLGPDEHFNDSDFAPNDDYIVVDVKPTTRANEVNTYAPIEPPPELPNPNVYDEHHQLLQRGEKIRLGKAVKDISGVESFLCGYCPQAWADIASLHTHVHTIHSPEVVDVAIPPELGLGNTMNCGVEIQNCQEPRECPKPWSCLFCDASFRARTNMSSHFKEKHTPYKPFSCADCGEAFRKGIDLNRHKLYFCAQRTVAFAPKRKYKKRDAKEKPSPLKRKIKSDEERCE